MGIPKEGKASPLADRGRGGGHRSSDFPYLRSPGALSVVFLLAGILPHPGVAQLISPGKLSESHAHLEGMGNCTQCHRLRTRGADPDRCLACHEPLARRIQERKGYHGGLDELACGRCHKEHLGKDFHLVTFSSESFVHDSTGFPLEGKHVEADCRSCHEPRLVSAEDVKEFKAPAGALDRTFLGLPTECGSCHGGDDPHRGQFSNADCGSCHDEEGWDEAPGFDHDQAGFQLEGAHREVECADCHKVEGGSDAEPYRRYRPLEAGGCDACHEDPHQSGMKGPCEGCHETGGWGRVRRDRVESSFDHGATSFPLEGAHAEAACRSCHVPASGRPTIRLRFAAGEAGTKSYPRPLHDSCASCHLDPHAGTVDRVGCDACHDGESWTPANFDMGRHDLETRFPLTGAHRVVPCVACHRGEGSGEGAPHFRIESFERCETCHREEDPHDGAFGDRACESCHSTSSFLMDSFDHQAPDLRGLIERCTVCHGESQPHGDQFPGRECGECHTTEGFEIQEFDHSGARFRLEGAHEELACSECHRREPDPTDPRGGLVRYRPLETTCDGCHGGLR